MAMVLSNTRFIKTALNRLYKPGEIMKLKIILLATAGLLTACQHKNADISIYHDENGEVTVTRTMTASSGAAGLDYQIVSCIALPEDWSGEIAVSGAATSEGTAYSVSGVEDSARTELMNRIRTLPGFDWNCFSDEMRTYDEDDSGTVTYLFAPDRENMTVLTTLGVADADGDDDNYQNQIVSHQLLATETTAAHWQLRTEGMDLSLSSMIAAGDSYFIFESDYSPYGETITTTRINKDGSSLIETLPYTDGIYFLNNTYISMGFGYSEGQPGSFLQYSTDLENWTEAGWLPSVQQLMYNPATALYVANVETASGPTAIYTSPDLVTWTSQVSAQPYNSRYYFMANGNMVAFANSGSHRLFLAAPGDDSWSEISYGENITLRDSYQTTDGRVHMISSGTSDSGVRGVFYGYTDDGENWIWKNTGDWDNPSELSHLAINEQAILAWSYRSLLLSLDGGETWVLTDADDIAPAIDTIDIADMDVSLGSVKAYGDQFLFSTEVSASGETVAGLVLATSDFSDYQVMASHQGAEVLTDIPDELFLFLSSYESSDVYVYWQPDVVPEEPVPEEPGTEDPTEEAPEQNPGENDDADNASGGSSSGGSLWLLNLLLLPLVVRRLKIVSGESKAAA